MSSVITSGNFVDMLVEAGVVTREQASRISRIVIDCNHDRPVQIYIQEYGQANALEQLAPMLKGMIDG